MKNLLGLGRYLFTLPILLFGVFHFMHGNAMIGMVPLPGGIFWVYFTGAALIAAAISILTGKYDRLASLLLGVMLLIFALSIHLPHVLAGDQAAMPNLLKDIALAGGAWLYGLYGARDYSFTG
ncbi:MAG: hypothetical protein R2798_07195 [Chitinophagales bacterium]|nr:DoxX family protein [Bacteroidota bacterium]